MVTWKWTTIMPTTSLLCTNKIWKSLKYWSKYPQVWVPSFKACLDYGKLFSLFEKQVMLSWFLSSNYKVSSKSSNFMFYDMGLVASNLFLTRIDQSLRQDKKRILTIQFQFVKICIFKTCAFGQEICNTWDPWCNEKNVKVLKQTLHVTKPHTMFWEIWAHLQAARQLPLPIKRALCLGRNSPISSRI
jgi:hypothetical protein